MAVQRNIQHPGVEIREIDKSSYTPAIEGTYCLLAGYADKGEDLNPLIVSNSQSFDTIYGEPTNEAERYFYYTGQEILRTGGTLVASKLPYDNDISKLYKAIGIKVEASTSISATVSSDAVSAYFGTSITSGQLDSAGYKYYSELSSESLTISSSEYDLLVAGNMDKTGNTDNTFPHGTTGFDFLLVNESKSNVTGSKENEGLIVAIVDPIDAMNVQRVLNNISDSDQMDLLSGFESPRGNEYIDGNDFAVNLMNDFSKSSVSEDIMRQFPAIEYLDGGDTINKEYSHHMGIVVCQVFAGEQDKGKLKIGILEAFVGSIHEGQRNPATGQSIYIGDMVNAGSKYFRMFFNSTRNASDNLLPTWITETQDNDSVLYKKSDIYPMIGFTAEESKKDIAGGQIKSELQKVFEKVSNIDDIQIDVVVDGGLSTIAQFTDDVDKCVYDPITDIDPNDVSIQNADSLSTWRDIVSEMIIFCRDVRKDCMTIIDVPRHLVLEGDSKFIRPTKPENTFSRDIGQKLKYVTGLNSSYGALYGNWFKMVDGFTGKNFWIPQSTKMAGIYIYNDRIANIWDAPAGLNRGIIYGVNDLAYNPNGKDADQLYIKSINYAQKYPLDGFIAEGQKTTQVKPSAFDRVNVRRLFLRLERLVYEVSRYFVYEPNNYFTRRRLVDMVDPIFSRIKQQGGMYDYQIICDESNNTPDVIDRNELKIAFFIKPVKTAEFILVDFVAVNTGTDFNEVINEVI